MLICRIVNKKYFLGFLFVFFILTFLFFILVSDVGADEIRDLQIEIENQQKYIQELEKQKKLYQEKIDLKSKEALTLKNQISIINDEITKTTLEIKEKEARIKENELSIANIQFKIKEQEEETIKQKKLIAELLNLIYRYDNKSHLEILFLNSSISDFFNQLRYLNNIQNKLQENIQKIKLIKEGLELQENKLRDKIEEAQQLKDELTQQKSILDTKKAGKKNLLRETQEAEWKFQSLLAEAIKEQKKAEQEIIRIEQEIRAKLTEQEIEKNLEEGTGPMIFTWPVPKNKITAYFHDPDYPYKKWLGEHSGIDIRAEQGTPIRAAASGYVGRAKNAGMGYSYIMLIHDNGFATVYGHVSQIAVQEEMYVKRGDIIGKTGGMPGTPGAGRFSTGPHLHFEVRLNGIPVNPLEYLP